MKKNIIITDSTTDLGAEYLECEDLKVIPLSYTIDDLCYKDYLDRRELSSEDFYEKIKNGKLSKTTQINPETFFNVFGKKKKKKRCMCKVLLLLFSW